MVSMIYLTEHSQVWLRDIVAIENSGPWIVGGRIDMLKTKRLFHAIYMGLPKSPLHQKPVMEVEISGVGVALDSYSVAALHISSSGGSSNSSSRSSTCGSVSDASLKHLLCSYSLGSQAVDAADLLAIGSSSANGSFSLHCASLRSPLFSHSRSIMASLNDKTAAVHTVSTNIGEGASPTPPESRGVFRRLLRSVKSLSFSSKDSSPFQLCGDDAVLLLLYLVLNRASTDLEILSEDSKLADAAESKRLVSKLTKAGLF